MSIIKHLKSKTQLFNLAIAVIGVLELNFHLLRENLGEAYGIAFILVSIGGLVLRTITTESIDAK